MQRRNKKDLAAGIHRRDAEGAAPLLHHFLLSRRIKSLPNSVGRWPVGAEGENIAIARNISGSRTVLSPTACGRSPLPEGAKGRARLFLQSEPPHSVGRCPSEAMAGGALHVLPRLTAPPSCTPTPDSPRSACGTRVGCVPTVYHIVTNKKTPLTLNRQAVSFYQVI